MATRQGNWKIKYTTYTGEAFAVVECPTCRQSMQTTTPERAIFVHCGGTRDVLTPEQQDILLGRPAPGDLTPGETIAAQNMHAAEIAAQAKIVHFNETATWEAVAAQVKHDADALYAGKQALEDAARSGPQIPSQPGPRQTFPYEPNIKDC